MSYWSELYQSVRRLGAERCRRGLRAFELEPGPQGPWQDCLVACAYGEPGELKAAIRAAAEPNEYAAAAQLLDLPTDDVVRLCHAFDGRALDAHGRRVADVRTRLGGMVRAVAQQ